MAPSISIREHIRWLPERESEPTSTLVLTSPENRFVDIRILKPRFFGVNEDVLPSSRLDWAFGGTSSSKIGSLDGEGHVKSHSQWHHWVDSRSNNAEEIVDEGDMYPIEGGERTLEKGKMVNPSTGLLTDYEEVWRDEKVIATPSKDCDVDEGIEKDVKDMAAEGVEKGSEEGVNGDRSRMCVVLILDDPASQARGMVVRVGQYCQAVLRVADHFSLERWQWLDKQDGWRRECRIGSMWVPCGSTFDEARVKLGGKVRYGDYVWEVVELSCF